MKKIDLFTADAPNMEIWYETNDPNFIQLNLDSFVPEHWLNYSQVPNGKYKNSIIKPINKYVENLYDAPDLVSISNNLVRLRQKTHAEIMLVQKTKKLVTIDRPHIRQYYNTAVPYPVPENCFDKVFKFYVPWVIDADVSVKFENVLDESPFFIYDQLWNFNSIPEKTKYIQPFLVPFSFKKEGPDMREPGKFGLFPVGSPMFDMVFEADDIIIEKIKEFYEKE
jgi:hypothetical protein